MLEQLFPAVPSGQAAKSVPAQKQKNLVGYGQFGAHQFQGINGVGRFVPLQFAGVHHQRRHTGHRALDHRQTVFCRHLRLVPMGRPGTGCQAQLIERQGFGDFQRTAQMADVHRVERSAQYANAARGWLADGDRG